MPVSGVYSACVGSELLLSDVSCFSAEDVFTELLSAVFSISLKIASISNFEDVESDFVLLSFLPLSFFSVTLLTVLLSEEIAILSYPLSLRPITKPVTATPKTATEATIDETSLKLTVTQLHSGQRESCEEYS